MQHITGLRGLYTALNIVKVIKSRRVQWVGHLSCMGEVRNTFKILVRKPKRKRPLWRHWCKWKGQVRMDLMEIGWEVANWGLRI